MAASNQNKVTVMRGCRIQDLLLNNTLDQIFFLYPTKNLAYQFHSENLQTLFSIIPRGGMEISESLFQVKRSAISDPDSEISTILRFYESFARNLHIPEGSLKTRGLFIDLMVLAYSSDMPVDIYFDQVFRGFHYSISMPLMSGTLQLDIKYPSDAQDPAIQIFLHNNGAISDPDHKQKSTMPFARLEVVNDQELCRFWRVSWQMGIDVE